MLSPVMYALSGPALAAEDDLRQRLTEREDQRRPPQPWSTLIGGRPLTAGGEYEIGLSSHRRRLFGGSATGRDRSLFEHTLEGEVFYSFGPPLSLFAQLRLGATRDLLASTPENISERFVERGEMWCHREIAGTGVSLEFGRLHFEDERRWWWDDELDAARLSYEARNLGVELAFARELGPARSDRNYVLPEHDHVSRFIAELSWDWSRNHAFELFLLHQDDGSASGAIGETLAREREDPADADLSWVGTRLIGAFDLRARGALGYWFDLARTHGKARSVEYQTLTPQQSAVAMLTDRRVRGWAADLGVNWALPYAGEPRLFIGYAFGSGDSAPGTSVDKSFRQSGIQANESGFGGVRRFAHYGVLLDPELSNLKVLTLGAGRLLLKSSSVDLIFHHYRLAEPAPSLRSARIDAALTGTHRDLGSGIDLVLALEEWQRVEFDFSAAAFRAGRAFGGEDGTWSYRVALAARIAF